MAIYHLSVKTVSRSKGRSATAAAAYRAGVEIADQRTGEVHDYSRKSGVAHREIILPDGADPKFEDRSTLWNEAEASEKRKNSTVAREYEVALPSELDPERRKALTHEFGEWLSERFGVGVDVAIHEPGREGDQRNHHAHVLTTTRKIEGGELTEKTRELDDRKTGAVEEVREAWEKMANRHLEQSQEQTRIDRRSFERQGIEKVPSVHLGPSASAMERRGEHSDRGSLNRLAAQLNQQLEAARAYINGMSRSIRERLGGVVKPQEKAKEQQGTGLGERLQRWREHQQQQQRPAGRELGRGLGRDR